jgi:ACS family glucarate transporter-like MFS transporter
MTAAIEMAGTRIGRIRFSIVAMLFAVTIVNYADRATIAIAGPVLSKDLGFSPVQMGFIFSAFGWSYVIGQIPGGWLLDRFGSKAVYFASIVTWSLFTLLQGAVGLAAATFAFYTLFALRFLVGLAEAPSFPANARVVAAWFRQTNGVRRPRSSTRRSISRPFCSPRSWVGSQRRSAGRMFSISLDWSESSSR